MAAERSRWYWARNGRLKNDRNEHTRDCYEQLYNNVHKSRGWAKKSAVEAIFSVCRHYSARVGPMQPETRVVAPGPPKGNAGLGAPAPKRHGVQSKGEKVEFGSRLEKPSFMKSASNPHRMKMAQKFCRSFAKPKLP